MSSHLVNNLFRIAGSGLVYLFYFTGQVLQQFVARRSPQAAASLAYTTLLSLVPLITVMLNFFSKQPWFKQANETIQEFIFTNFVPSFGQIIRDHLVHFSAKATHLTTAGSILLVIIALMLMYTINSALDHIWHIKKRRRLLARFLVYWTILTLGPVLIGIGLYATSYLLTLPLVDNVDSTLHIKSRLLTLMPLVTTSIALTLVYILVPNVQVNRRHAIAGGVTAAILFELAKHGFALYLKAVPTYQIIYGAMAVIPIFLLWIYISWLIVLLGAQISYSLSVFRLENIGQPERHWDFLDAYRLLGPLWQAQKKGESRSVAQLKKSGVKISHHAINEILDLLGRAQWVDSDAAGQWRLTRDLGNLRLLDLYKILPCKLPSHTDLGRDKWDKTIQGVLADSDASLTVALAIPMHKVLSYVD